VKSISGFRRQSTLQCAQARDLVARAGEFEGRGACCGPLRAVGCTRLVSCLETCERAIEAEPCAIQVPAWKRILDVSLVLLTCPFWLPAMAMIAIYIRVVAPGSVLYRQARVSVGGRRFACLKFRTMKANADTAVHEKHLHCLIANGSPMTKIDDMGDERLIRGGRFLRLSGLDELPQLFNVLRGEMSLVGPRPCTPFEYEHYQEWQRKRFCVLPGLTGLWQVSGKNKTSFRQMILLDIYYILHAGPLLDVRIMLKTLRVVLGQVGDSRAPQKSSQPSYAPALKNQRLPAS
jgi:lipopolysaccharide/colanic/teichoic acid biosynthesis glycosyltransferase